jgi:hypothetical protein
VVDVDAQQVVILAVGGPTALGFVNWENCARAFGAVVGWAFRALFSAVLWEESCARAVSRLGFLDH